MTFSPLESSWKNARRQEYNAWYLSINDFTWEESAGKDIKTMKEKKISYIDIPIAVSPCHNVVAFFFFKIGKFVQV